MFTKPINNTLKKHVDEIANEATRLAETEFHEKIKSKLTGLDHFNQVKLLSQEEERLDDIIDNHDYPFYVANHSSGEWLLNQFASRTYLLNVDETEQLSGALFIGHYNKLVSEALWKMREGVPHYDYEKFMQGIICPYFENFKNMGNVSEEDYYKIKDWQADNLMKIVSYEYLIVIEDIQQHCKTLSDPLEFIKNQKEIIEEKLDNTTTAKEAKAILKELFAFEKVDVDKLDDELLLENFEVYKSQIINWKGINPKQLASVLRQVENRTLKPLTIELTLFYSINKVADWFDLVLEGKPIFEKVTDPNWLQLLEEIKSEAAKEVETLCEPIYEYTENPKVSKKDKGEFLIEKFEEYRHKFNDFDRKDYFSVLREEKADVLKRAFITNSFFGNDLNIQSDNIKKAMVIHEMSWNIVGIYGELFDTHRVKFANENDGESQIMSLMHEMVLDKELYNGLRSSLDQFMEEYHRYFMPFDFYSQNQKDNMSRLFHQSMEKLQDILDEAEPSSKILFLQSRLKDLKLWELKMKQFEHHKDFNKRDYKYSKLFKQFLEIQADFIKETREVNPYPVLSYKPKPLLITASQTKTFDETFPGEKGVFVMQLLEDLSITTDGKAQLASKKVGAIRGVVEALRENHIAPQLNLNTLCCMLADKIGTQIKSGKIDASNTSEDFLKKAKQYISANYKAAKTV